VFNLSEMLPELYKDRMGNIPLDTNHLLKWIKPIISAWGLRFKIIQPICYVAHASNSDIRYKARMIGAIKGVG